MVCATFTLMWFPLLCFRYTILYIICKFFFFFFSHVDSNSFYFIILNVREEKAKHIRLKGHRTQSIDIMRTGFHINVYKYLIQFFNRTKNNLSNTDANVGKCVGVRACVYSKYVQMFVMCPLATTTTKCSSVFYVSNFLFCGA